MLAANTALLAAIALTVIVSPVHAAEATVLASEFRRLRTGAWQVSSTLSHADTGWEHYADAWRVVGEDGSVYGTRVLYHPHATEQPFTRSLGEVKIPSGVSVVFVEAHDNVHGWSPGRLRVDLDKAVDGRLRVEP